MKISDLAISRLKTGKSASIYSKEEFYRLFERERDRSLRSGGFFALLVLEPKQTKFVNRTNLIKIAGKRIRNIDTLGWFDDHRLGLILPETSHEGADKVGKDIQSLLAPKQEIQFSIFTYPSPSAASNPSFKEKKEKQDPSSGSAQFQFTDLFGKPMPLWKRLLDIIGASLAIVLLLPLLLAVATYIKCVSHGPVFFRQKRLGYMAKPFTCWKFRTMKPDADSNKHRFHVHELIHSGRQLVKIDDEPDASIIPFGNVIRKLGIDELPQLFNVLCGEMSLVGPRPCMDYEAAEFKRWQNKRFDTPPGLTGLWQVSGKNRTTFDEMMRLDIKYVQNRSLARDMIIFVETIPAIIRQVTDKMTLNEADYESNH